LADAGYFEAIAFTSEDTQRNQQYVANRERKSLQSNATDMDGFLRDLEMVLTVSPFQSTDIGRITQLINKTNQFNLTTRRYTEAEVRALMQDPEVVTLTARLADKFGDNGLISIVIGRRLPEAKAPAVEIDTWLMSCRVLGRRMEQAMLALIASESRERGIDQLIGRYSPSKKNGMVKDHYSKLGFTRFDGDTQGQDELWILNLPDAELAPLDHFKVVRPQ
jgi:FkbH-like protein